VKFVSWIEALEIVVAKTKNERYRELCADDHPEREIHRARIVAKAYPSLLTQAGNAAGAAGRMLAAVVTGRAVQVDDAEYARRLDLCHACEQYDARADKCLKCGCVARWKARLSSEHCPLSNPKW
jgi:hypothetical protein